MKITPQILAWLNGAMAMRQYIDNLVSMGASPKDSQWLELDTSGVICDSFLYDQEDFLKKYAIIEWSKSKFHLSYVKSGVMQQKIIDISNYQILNPTPKI